MKKCKIVIAIILIFSIILAANDVFADSSVTWASGDYRVSGSVGETKVAEIKFENASDEIGIVSGTITSNSEYVSIESVERGDWSLTYNPNNGKFNSVKSTGDRSATILKITYKILKEASNDTNVITISGLKYTSTSYNTYLESNPINVVLIKGSTADTSDTTDTSSTSDTTDTSSTSDTTDTSSTSDTTDTSSTSDTSSTTDTSNNNNQGNNNNNNNNGNDTTMSNKGLPYTGRIIGNSIKILLVAAVVIILTVRYFVKYKKIDVE